MDRVLKICAAMIAPVLLTPIAEAQITDVVSDTQRAMQVQPAGAAATQEFCITVMREFPDDSDIARYQFFRLSQDLAADATPQLQAALEHYGDPKVDQSTPILDVIETIANPVLRQAAPQIIVANMAHLIDFQTRCASYVDGQVDSLAAFDASLSESDAVIAEDALFLRQVLSDSLARLDVAQHPEHWYAAGVYAGSLVTTRDVIEFTAYADEVDDLEALYMVDLDGRLARSNDMINEEMDRNALSDAVLLAEDMNKAEKEKAKQNTLETLFRILNRY